MSGTAQQAAVEVFKDDGGAAFRARAVELRRAELSSAADDLSARFSLWRRARAAGGWIATVELRRGADGATRSVVHDAADADALLDAMEAWSPDWAGQEGAPAAGPEAAVALDAYAARMAELRLQRFYKVALGEVLADWC